MKKDIQDLGTNKSRLVPGGSQVVEIRRTLKRLNNNMTVDISIGQMCNFCKKYTVKNVLLVGSNPGQASPDNTPFHPDTKSRRIVDGWFDDKEGWCVTYDNLVDFKTDKNKQLSKSQIKKNLEWIKKNMNIYVKQNRNIVACGKIAAMGLTMAGIEHFEMPHPSGLCRFWNDKEASEAKIEEMKEWIISQK